MPYARPTLAELRQRALQDITSETQGESGLLRRAILRVLATVQAGFAYLHYGYQDYIAKQAVPWSAEDEYAAGWGALKGVERKDATRATGTLIFAAEVGASIPAGTMIARSDGVQYVAISEGVWSAGTLTVAIRAAEAGSIGNTDANTAFYLVNAITGVTSKTLSTVALTGGADQEKQEEFKARYLEAYAEPPQGGSATDYVRWAKEVPGVTRAWCVPNGAGAGTVVVYIMLDEVRASGDGFPQGTDGVASQETRAVPATGDQLIVANYIYPLRPVTALVYACAPIADDYDFVLDDLTPATPTMKAAIEEALRDMFVRLGTAAGGTIYPSDWNEAVKSVSGIKHFTVAQPIAPISTEPGHFPRLRSLSATS
ncbi:MAG TPA: baseplate J/gp47 family protein [Roseomonas sp.]|nr:baseplate J/gp47 family protein [Roseomonas sp.]